MDRFALQRFILPEHGESGTGFYVPSFSNIGTKNCPLYSVAGFINGLS
jgi:hypothetical protein